MAPPSAKLLFQAALRDPSLSITRKVVGWSLSTYMSHDGIAWPSVASIAAGAGICERSARRALRDLEAVGLLEVQQRRGKPALYLATPDTALSALPSDTPDTALSAHPGHSSVQDPGHSSVPRSYQEGSKALRAHAPARGGGAAPEGWIPEDDDAIAAEFAAREAAKVKGVGDGEGWQNPDSVALARDAARTARAKILGGSDA